MEYFVVSDIHGQYSALNKLLQYWNPDKQQLVLLGDYIDRGHHSLEVLKKVMKLVKDYGAVATMGNHEELFLMWLEDADPESSDDYKNHMGRNTIASFLTNYPIPSKPSYPMIFTADRIRKHILQNHQSVVQFLKNLPLYYETPTYIFVHAGIPPYLRDLKNGTAKDFLWIRNLFLFHPHEIDKIVVFGHTQTFLLHNHKDDTGVWVDSTGTKIGIDGGAGSNRYLNGVVLKEEDANPILYQVKVK